MDDGDEGDDGDDDDEDEDNEDKVPNIDGHQFSLGNNKQWPSAETSSKKPGAKLPSLHPRQHQWDGE